MAVRSAYLAKKGDKPTKAKSDLKNSGLSAEEELKAYYDMLLIRRFEEKAGQLYGMGVIGGFCHLYIGQEAVVVGMEMAAIEGDQRITSYRDHGHMLACGMEAKGVMAELTRGRLFKGQGRLYAYVQPRKTILWRPRHCGCASATGRWACIRQQISWQ
jgi:pyruvate dehydrogenase E1 component alpha subunit